MLMPAIGDFVPWHWKQYCFNIGAGLGAASSAPRIVWPTVRTIAAHEKSATATFRRRALTDSPRSRGNFIGVSLFYVEGRTYVHTTAQHRQASIRGRRSRRSEMLRVSPLLRLFSV